MNGFSRAARQLMPIAATLALAAPAVAQQDTTRMPPGVELETRYSLRGRQAVAVRPFAGPIPLAGLTAQVAAIVTTDLGLSDRFDMFPAPATLAAPGPVDYAAWNSLNVVWLVTGDLIPTGSGFELRITAHDVVFGMEKQSGTFMLPPSESPDFRMAVHVASDAIVMWLTGQPGMAATRIAFIRQNAGSYDLLLVDSDGEDLRRVAGSPSALYSPTWSPDGSRLAYAQSESDGWRLVERDLVTGRTRAIDSGRDLVQTPVYSPDGRKLAYAVWVSGGLEIFEIDLSRNGQPVRITDSGGDNIAPTFSPDGNRLAFLSTRTGRQHIFVMNDDGSAPRILSPYGARVEFHAPDWNPLSAKVVFHGAAGGPYQIMVADADRGQGSQVLQLTSAATNEDPSWAPDGRHIVYTGSGADTDGLYVIDTVTGTIRLLVRGVRLRTADWSPSLATVVNSAG